eukprot:m.23120 g.23120  ORF g.23120 m.23120 type:complete len:444 (-) comp14079_c0_seq1:50-1381(-)
MFTNAFQSLQTAVFLTTCVLVNGEYASKIVGFRNITVEGFNENDFGTNLTNALLEHGVGDVAVTRIIQSNAPNVNQTGIVADVEFDVNNASFVAALIRNQSLVVTYGVERQNHTQGNNTNNTNTSEFYMDENTYIEEVEYTAFLAFKTSMFINAAFDDIPEDRMKEFFAAMRSAIEILGVTSGDIIATPVVSTDWPLEVTLEYIGEENFNLITKELEIGVEIPFIIDGDDLRLVATSNQPATTVSTTAVPTTTAGYKPIPDVLFNDSDFDLTLAKLVVAAGFAFLVSTFLFSVLLASQVRKHCFKKRNSRAGAIPMCSAESLAAFSDFSGAPESVILAYGSNDRIRSYGATDDNNDTKDVYFGGHETSKAMKQTPNYTTLKDATPPNSPNRSHVHDNAYHVGPTALRSLRLTPQEEQRGQRLEADTRVQPEDLIEFDTEVKIV